MQKRHAAAAVIGNALEFYDFLTFAYFAVQIGHVFFPSKNPFFELMATLLTFGGGFIMRPVGAVVIGRFADRIGRKPAMMWCFTLMGLSVLAMALIPSYASIGVAAPIILVAVRLVQGFAVGGDVGPTTAFLMEACPPSQRGFYCTLQFTSQGIATVLAGVVGLILANILSDAALTAYGWRIAFALGASVLPVGLYLRRTVPETLETGPAETANPEKADIGRVAVAGLLIIMGSTTSVYVFNYMSTYAQTVLHMKANVSFAATLVFGICNVVFSTIGGVLSDRYGRLPIMLWPRVAFLFVSIPVFMFIVRDGTPFALLAGTAVLAALAQTSSAAALVAITESLPKHLRSTTLATIYAVGVALFGGTTQPVVLWLLHVTNDKLAPSYYLAGTTIIYFAALLLMRETAPVKTGRADP